MVAAEPELVADPDELLHRVDGLIVSGGVDMDPASYGAAAPSGDQGLDHDRDAFELALIRRAAEIDMPVLGVCRGMQVLNVAFGGTLFQHLPETLGHEDHRRVPATSTRPTTTSASSRTRWRRPPRASSCTPPSPTTTRASTRWAPD